MKQEEHFHRRTLRQLNSIRSHSYMRISERRDKCAVVGESPLNSRPRPVRHVGGGSGWGSLTGSRADSVGDMKEVAATTPLSLERYPFCAALHWIVVAAGVFCSLNREISATATHTARKCRIFSPKHPDGAGTITRNSWPSQRKRQGEPRKSLTIIWTTDDIVMQTTPLIDDSPFVLVRAVDVTVTLRGLALRSVR
jgi:hypothetical protein